MDEKIVRTERKKEKKKHNETIVIAWWETEYVNSKIPKEHCTPTSPFHCLAYFDYYSKLPFYKLATPQSRKNR